MSHIQTEFEEFMRFRAQQKADPESRIPAADVRAICGVSDMTLWRWIKDSELNFPQPIIINRRRYWKRAEVVAWLEGRK